MLYHNLFVPHYVPAVYVPPSKCRKKKKKKTKFAIYAAPYKKKRYSLASYLKYVLWKKFRRYWKKRRARNKKKKSSKAPSVSVLSNKGSEEKIDLRDFWGSRYGSQWLFAKEKKMHQVNRNHLIDIIDAFKTKDLKYANRHSSGQRHANSNHHGLIDCPDRKTFDQISRKSSKCPCCRKSRQKEAGGTDISEWSLSTVHCQQRLHSKWPANKLSNSKNSCAKLEQFTSLLSRQHAYLYNWLNVDHSQNRCSLAMSKECLDKIRMRIDNSRPSSRRQGSASRTSCSFSESGSCSSTMSRRQRAKMLKRQRRAKEKASILWLLSKAFGGRIPSDLKDPFYRDHDNVRRLKPKIVHSLSNAELYCLALVNIYSDPNYNNLDHQGIIQALTRKGICLVESRDAPLTETTLVQTAPLRLNAHMSVIDGIMCLFIKEVLIPEKLVEVCRKFSTVDINGEMPSNSEEAAVLWVNKCCKTLEKEIRSECNPEEENKLPKIPVLQEISDISDGCCLAAVISYYCPNYLRWQDIVWNDPMSLGDSIHNLQLIRKFCVECLPREIHFFALEDLLYLHPSIKENVLAFVSDLLFMFVITKATCVTRKQEKVPKEPSRIPLESSKSLSNFPSHKSPVVCSPIPNLRSDSYGGSTSSLPDIRPGSRTKVYGSKEKLAEKMNIKKSNLSSEEIGPNQLQRTNSVGVVNGWKSSNLPYVGSTDSVSGSPRHTAESRPAVEGESASSNFSQPSISNEDINLAKHSHITKTNFAALSSPQREQIYGLRKNSEGFLSCTEGNLANGELRKARKSLEDYYNQLAGVEGPLRSVSASNITENKGWRNCEKFSPRSSVPESASSQSSGICLSDVDSKQNFSTTSFAQLSKLRDGSSSSINIIYMNNEKDGFDRDKHSTKSPSTPVKRIEVEGKKTTFAALPNTTTWQQQHAVNASANYPQTDSGHETPTEPVDTMINAQLCNIKMKLEEKKRKIELKKKRMELLWKKQRQKLGKAAFLQAVSKSSNAEAGTPDSGTGKEVGEVEFPPMSLPVIQSTPSLVKKMSIQEIAEDLDSVQKKWLNQTEAAEQLPLSDSVDFAVDTISGGVDDTMNIDLQTSIEHLNTSLTDLQADISRISLQQEQVENLMKDSIDDCSHFFLHGQSSNDNHFSTSPNRGPLHWQFNDSSFSLNRGGYKELDSKEFSYLSSPQLQESRTPYISQPKMSSFASLPPCPSVNKAPPAEELYSKVIKPENRQKVQSNVRTTATSVNRMQSSNTIDHSKPVQSKTSTEIHIVLPQVPDSKCDDSSTGKKSKDGFYIPIEKEVKKTKPKAFKSKTASDMSSVPNSINVPNEASEDSSSFGFVIGADLVHPDPETETEMARKKEMIMNMSIQRKAEYERRRVQKEQEYARLKEEERRKQEQLERKREEEKKRREAILEQYRQRKLQEELEKEGNLPHKDTAKLTKHRTSVSQVKKNDNRLSMNFTKPVVELRNQLTTLRRNNNRREGKPRPRSAYVPMNSDLSSLISIDNAANKRNSHIFPGRDIQEFDLDSLNSGSTSTSSRDRPKSPNSFLPHHRNANLNLQIPEGSNPSSDGASDTASNGSSAAAIDYTGPKLFVKPAAKSNRGIIINAINTVLAGAVNSNTKKNVLEEINRSDSKHFLILFRDAGCQFRALYTYNPEREEVTKLYGIGPKNITDKMMDRFYKYNSGGKCFSEIQTKHLTVTIDAFTIPNSLWAGKKMIPPRKEFF